jgi:hypothetical protein
VFSVFAGQGRPLLCVVLLAQASDPRLRAFRSLDLSPDATHVLLFLAFSSESEWEKEARQMAKLFPEQPGGLEFVVELEDE